MKKLFTLLGIGLFAGAAYSQIIFQEDFDGIPGPTAGGPGTYVFPPGWLLRNVENGTPATGVAYVNEAWERREDFNFNTSDSVAFSTSWTVPATTANDWMWTPMISTLPANCVLSWNAVAYDPSYRDGYEVRIMTQASTPGGPTGGTGVIGNQITNSTVLFSIAAENTAWTARSLSLSAYAGQSVWIGWRNNSFDKFLLIVDDIKVEVQNPYDAELLSLDTISPYTIIPKSQVTALPLEGVIRNNGISSITSAGLKVDIYDASNTLVHTDVSPTTTLASGASATFTIPSWTPPSFAMDYTFKFYPVLAETDPQPLNDTLIRTISIDDSTYARDNGTVVGALGIGAGVGGFLGQQFSIVTPARLSNIGMYVTRGYTGKSYGLAVWDMVAGVPNSIVAGTDTLIYPDDSADYYICPMYGGDVLLAPGQYVVTAIEFDSTVQVGLTMDIFTPNSTWVNWSTSPLGGWGNNEDFGSSFARAYVIRPYLVPECPAAIIDSINSTDAGCGLSDGTAEVFPSGSGSYSYVWNTGGTTSSISGLPAGMYTVIVTDSYSFCSETDTVYVVNPNAPLANISASTDESCAACNDGTATVSASGGTPGYTYSWAPAGGTGASATGLAPGTYTVTVTDAASCSATTTVTINAYVGAGVQDEIGLGSASVYPNPSNGTFTISGHFTYEGDMLIEMLNMLGEVVFTKPMTVSNDLNTQVSVQLPAGVYMVRLTAGNNRTVKEIIIK